MLVIAGALVSPGLSFCSPETPPQQEPPLSATTNDYLVALTILYEATNQPRLGQALVGRVVINRAEYIGAEYYELVTFARGQFVAWTPERRMAFLRCQIEGDGATCFDQMAFERTCYYTEVDCEERWWNLLRLVTSLTEDLVGFEGVRYFDNPAYWPDTDGMPPWAYSKVSLGCIGNHCFWR